MDVGILVDILLTYVLKIVCVIKTPPHKFENGKRVVLILTKKSSYTVIIVNCCGHEMDGYINMQCL